MSEDEIESIMYKKILLLSKYNRLGASSRLRMLQYVPFLEQAGLQVTLQPLLSDELLQARYQSGAYKVHELLFAYAKRLRAVLERNKFDVLWIEKEALPWWPLLIELSILRDVSYVLDYDDAVFLNYDNHRNPWLRCIFNGRLDGLMANASLVVCGNKYLAQHARNAGSTWVEVIPTVLNLDNYPLSTSMIASDGIPRIVWIGSPSTTHYLQILCEPLAILARNHSFVLRVIGGGKLTMPGVKIEVMPWSEDTELESISDCQIGVMPLHDSDWEKGKCGYKLIQYMACKLPVVASCIGVNLDIVQHGVNGFLASSSNDWVYALESLLVDSSRRLKLGAAGRNLVEEKYCIQQISNRMVHLLQAAAET
jgi:glycosyltransferase involved in cell wall biosynthesis